KEILRLVIVLPSQCSCGAYMVLFYTINAPQARKGLSSLCQKSRFVAQTFTPDKSTTCPCHKSVPK
ncbi:MAG: hypothetical protein M0Q44_21835, partial [Methylobacter sp.]|nr:hypothetical protein [Methylobacter sp.]